MGVSTDAVLFYGYVWSDETDLFNDNDGETEWSEVVLAKRGLVDPYGSYPDGAGPEERNAWVQEHEAETSAWYAAKRAVEEEFGVDLDHHGSDGWRVPYIHIKETEITAARGYPQKLDPAHFGPPGASQPEWNTKLATFVEALEIDLSEAEGPGWFLVSWWG